MKTVFMLALIAGVSVYAHDEGHGPKLTDNGKYGGVVAPVVDAKSGHSAHAPPVYKAELVRSDENKISIYLYDTKMQPLEVTKLPKEAKGALEVKEKGKWKKSPFSLALENGVLSGQIPKPSKKPYNVEMVFADGSRNLLVAFTGLD